MCHCQIYIQVIQVLTVMLLLKFTPSKYINVYHISFHFQIGGEIVFRGDSGKEFDLTIHEHRFGEGILHLGCHLHKALPIESGERWNLIIWMRSSEKRNKICPMCQTTPEKIPAPFYGDGFTV